MDHGIDISDDNDIDFNSDHDGDFSHDLDADYDIHDMSHSISGLRVFTVRGIVAFCAVGGWTGLAIWDLTRNAIITLIGAYITGTLALLFAAFVIQWALKMQESGNVDPQNAISKMATVYIPVHPNRTLTGRVTLTLQERLVEMEAITDSSETLKTGEIVQVVAIEGSSTLVVAPVRS
jgi:exosortase/archaeosortase